MSTSLTTADEGRSGGGPDTRSSSSVSSHSSMKMIGAKLKQQGRTRWLVLALIVLIAVLLIIGITIAVYFARNSGEDAAPLKQVGDTLGTTTQSDDHLTSYTTTLKSVTHTTKMPTQIPTTPKPTTPKPTTQKPATQKSTTKQPTTKKTTTQPPATKAPTTTVKQTTLEPTTGRHTTQRSTTQVRTTQAPTTKDIGVTRVTSGTSPALPVNMTVRMNDILYNPTDVTSLTLMCEGRHNGKWETLTIRKQFKDGYEPIAIVVVNQEDFVEVFKLYPNISHIIDVTAKYVALSLTLDPFYCVDLTNYTCALTNIEETVTASSNVSVFMPEPELIVPHSIVEDNEVTLECIADVWGNSGAAVVWKFKPEFATSFMEFSVQPFNNITQGNCSTHIYSTLTFNITMFEDSASFRCEILYNWTNPVVIQKATTDVFIRVVPGNYCDGKQLSTLHPHPHGPCTVAVFCHENGPLVYEIECEPGFCYDYVKTACVPQGTR